MAISSAHTRSRSLPSAREGYQSAPCCLRLACLKVAVAAERGYGLRTLEQVSNGEHLHPRVLARGWLSRVLLGCTTPAREKRGPKSAHRRSAPVLARLRRPRASGPAIRITFLSLPF